MGASVCHADSFCGLGGSAVQHSEMRPRSRKEQYDTSGAPQVEPLNHGFDGADAAPSSVRLKDGDQKQAVASSLSEAKDLRGSDAGDTPVAADDGTSESLAANYFLKEAGELQNLQHFGGGPLVRARKRHVFKTGAVYDGQWLGNARDGLGKQTWPDGAEYIGEWKNNVVTGMGSFAHGDGDRYIGMWRKRLLVLAESVPPTLFTLLLEDKPPKNAGFAIMILTLERPLRNALNQWFRGMEPYEILRRSALLALAVKLLARLRWIMRHEGLKAFFLDLVMPYLKKLPMVQAKLQKEMLKTQTDMRAAFSKDLTDPRTHLPGKGIPDQEILTLIDQRKQLDTTRWTSGKITGAVYHGGQEHYDFIGKVFSKWAFCNPLHPDLHPSLRQMDAEVVRMVINLYNGREDACGAFTTGGTESILMAMKAHRDWGAAEKGIREPNIVVCNTAHAAFDKAGKYFKIFVKKARTDTDMAVDLKHLEQLIDGNTVAIVGSCCQYAHGTVDPIESMGKIAKKHNVGLHVDCCLGGFLVPFMEKAGYPLPPFDFRVPGVTSISCDPHKYGFAPKGSSVVMFSSRELRHHMYCYLTDWSGGIYATPTMTGSRPGGPVAATWAAMCRFGVEGYVETTRQIVGAARQIAEGIKKIQGIHVVGRAEVCVVAFDTDAGAGFSCYAVADCLKQQSGWELATCQNPACVHLAVTLLTAKNAKQFLIDLEAAVQAVQAARGDPDKFKKTAGMYGMAATLPAAFIEDAVGAYVDAMSEAYAGPAADGFGTESWPDKSRFIGEFSRGKKSGSGEYQWPDGSKYQGQWCMNMIDGFGIYMGVDGREYRGRWMASTMNGCGRYKWIAKMHLSPQEVQKTERILATWSGDFPGMSDFVNSAVWPDHIKCLRNDTLYCRGLPATALNEFNAWHFVDVDFTPDHLAIDERNPYEDPSAVWALTQAMRTFYSSRSNFALNLMLRFALHIVGDAHQPLHTAQGVFNDTRFGHVLADRGGNLIRIQSNWSTLTNLHAFWDAAGGMYLDEWPYSSSQEARRDRNASIIVGDFPKSSLQEYQAEDMDCFLIPSDCMKVFKKWVQEAHILAVQHAYVGVRAGAPVSDTYVAEVRQISKRQLALAGYRLADLLRVVLPLLPSPPAESMSFAKLDEHASFQQAVLVILCSLESLLLAVLAAGRCRRRCARSHSRPCDFEGGSPLYGVPVLMFLVAVDGRCYQGQYARDQKDGFGIFKWADGRRYEGYWSKGRQHGIGRLCNSQGAHRLARWENGERKEWLEEEQNAPDMVQAMQPRR
ncbi:spl-1 [Symbiodinium sp. CCMP2456]|nr:spl-1 [Symbiodinium sp. CCMP2456]